MARAATKAISKASKTTHKFQTRASILRYIFAQLMDFNSSWISSGLKPFFLYLIFIGDTNLAISGDKEKGKRLVGSTK